MRTVLYYLLMGLGMVVVIGCAGMALVSLLVAIPARGRKDDDMLDGCVGHVARPNKKTGT